MPQFTVLISHTRYYQIGVEGADEAAAGAAAMRIWRESATVAQWEIPDEKTEIVDYSSPRDADGYPIERQVP